jgi:hypothetical protein
LRRVFKTLFIGLLVFAAYPFYKDLEIKKKIRLWRIVNRREMAGRRGVRLTNAITELDSTYSIASEWKLDPVKINRKSVKANQFELLVLPFSDSRYRST